MTTSSLPIEYLLVSDTNSRVLKSSHDYNEICKLAAFVIASGGQVTIFRSLKTFKARSPSTKKAKNETITENSI